MPLSDQIACCAHLNVQYAPERVGNPSRHTYRDRWLCADCNSEFVPRKAAEYAQRLLNADLDAERAARQRTKDSEDKYRLALDNVNEQLQRTKDALALAQCDLAEWQDYWGSDSPHDTHAQDGYHTQIGKEQRRANIAENQLAQSQEVAGKLAEALGRLRDSVKADQSQLDKDSSFDAAYAASNAVLSLYASHRPADANVKKESEPEDETSHKGHGWITGTADIDAMNAEAAERDAKGAE